MKTLAQRILESREEWCELGGELKVRLRRPAHLSMAFMHAQTPNEQAQRAIDAVVDWAGFSEATFFGPAIGSSDHIPFDAEAWREYASDHIDVATKVFEHFHEMLVTFAASREKLAGN